MIDGGWIETMKLKIARGFERGASGLGDFAHTPLDEIENLEGQRSDRAFDLTKLRQHIIGLTGMNHRYRDNGRIRGTCVSANDGLEGLHHLTRDGHRVDARVRECRVRAFTADDD